MRTTHVRHYESMSRLLCELGRWTGRCHFVEPLTAKGLRCPGCTLGCKAQPTLRVLSAALVHARLSAGLVLDRLEYADQHVILVLLHNPCLVLLRAEPRLSSSTRR